jgi:hypothetical protein
MQRRRWIMKRMAFLMTVLSVVTAFGTTASQAGVDIDVNIGTPPPPPAVFFEREPEVVLVPRTKVYYVPRVSEYDMYRHGSYWYVNKGGYWYRARKYAGPFTVVEYRTVPREIIVLPREYHHHPIHPHGGPPGQMKKHGHKHGHGHGHKD